VLTSHKASRPTRLPPRFPANALTVGKGRPACVVGKKGDAANSDGIQAGTPAAGDSDYERPYRAAAADVATAATPTAAAAAAATSGSRSSSFMLPTDALIRCKSGNPGPSARTVCVQGLLPLRRRDPLAPGRQRVQRLAVGADAHIRAPGASEARGARASRGRIVRGHRMHQPAGRGGGRTRRVWAPQCVCEGQCRRARRAPAAGGRRGGEGRSGRARRAPGAGGRPWPLQVKPGAPLALSTPFGTCSPPLSMPHICPHLARCQSIAPSACWGAFTSGAAPAVHCMMLMLIYDTHTGVNTHAGRPCGACAGLHRRARPSLQGWSLEMQAAAPPPTPHPAALGAGAGAVGLGWGRAAGAGGASSVGVCCKSHGR
jgi:hypothetical protein